MENQRKHDCMLMLIAQTEAIIQNLKDEENKYYTQYYRCKEVVSDVESLSVVQMYLSQSKSLEKYMEIANKHSEQEIFDKIDDLRNQVGMLRNDEIVISYLNGKKNLEELKLQCVEVTRLRRKYENDLEKYNKELFRYKRRIEQNDTEKFM